MLHLATLAVGGPGPVLPQAWDATPLAIGATLAILLRWSRVPLKTRSALAIALAGGIALDLLGDAVGISAATTIALLCLAFAATALRRTRAV